MDTLELNCTYCGGKFCKKASKHRYDISKGKTEFFCTPAHVYEYRRAPLIIGVCGYCGEGFSRKKSGRGDTGKFCSRTCSAVNSSKTSAWKRRGEQNKCVECGVECARRKRCVDCTSKINPLASTSLNELRSGYGTAEFHAKIRGNARAVFNRSGRKKSCIVCKYNLHVDICHVKPVKDFDGDSLISEVNDPANLAALCKRCHWEFDNGYLTVLPSN